MTGDIDSARIILWIDLSAQALDAARAELSELDGAVGDGDHGRSMAEGMAAAAAAIRSRVEAAPAQLFRDAGTAFLGRVGATVGPLYASAFFRCGDAETNVPALLDAICDGIAARGGAKAGDCTMIDAWYPAARAAHAAADKGSLALDQAEAARDAAFSGAEATRAMIAVHGRTVRLGNRSLGHVDPGARSAALIVGALCDALEDRR